MAWSVIGAYPVSQPPVQRRQYNAGSLQYSLLSNLMFGVQVVSASYDIFFERSRPVRLNYIEAHIQQPPPSPIGSRYSGETISWSSFEVTIGIYMYRLPAVSSDLSRGSLAGLLRIICSGHTVTLHRFDDILPVFPGTIDIDRYISGSRHCPGTGRPVSPNIEKSAQSLDIGNLSCTLIDDKAVLSFDYETWNQLGVYSEYRIK